MKHPPRAVIFDYGNVIANFDVSKYFGRIAQFTSLGIDELREAMKDPPGLMDLYESGKMTSVEFFEELRARGRLSITLEEFVPVYCDIFTPIDTTQRLIETLRDRYQLGLLSNTSEWHFEYEIRRNKVFPLFDAVTLSFEVRARKPAEEIYRDILNKLRLSPDKCIYIDDIAEFAHAATSLGMRGIHYQTPEGLIRSLSDEGIEVAEE